MLGQGLGPVSDPELRADLRLNLPQIDFLTLREGREALCTLRSLARIESDQAVTGDEAIELAYGLRHGEIGNCIGINLRVARHSGVERGRIDIVRRAISSLGGSEAASFMPLPIALHRFSNDNEVLNTLLAGISTAENGAESLTTPEDVIRQAGRCRIVVTGAYHAAVFALSQGIPAVCLGESSNEYYMFKFRGLKDLFPAGVSIVLLDEENPVERLSSAIVHAWDSAPARRPEILRSAKQQMEAGRYAYSHLASLVNTHLAGERSN
jgi:colanic acid/amylovoran biosynthesis protein